MNTVPATPRHDHASSTPTKDSVRLLGVGAIIALIAACAPLSESYLEKHPDLAPSLREAISQKRVVLGMNPDEAQAAGGQFTYLVRPDRKYWGVDSFPPQVIYAQRTRPDASHIELTFRNATQYNTPHMVSFTVLFQQGRAVGIHRNTP